MAETAKAKKNMETKGTVKAEVTAEMPVAGTNQKTDPGKVRVELKSAQKGKTGTQSVKKETMKTESVKTEDKKGEAVQKETAAEKEKKASAKQKKTLNQGNQVVHVTEELPVYLL